MRHEFTREQLYDLVWSRPIRHLAAEHGISDAALARSLRKHRIPQPPRGHWAIVAAGGDPGRDPLPQRPFGAPACVRLGRDDAGGGPASGPVPIVGRAAESTFAEDEDEAAVARRAARMVGEVAPPEDLARPHPVIARLLRADALARQARRAAGTVSIFDRPRFEGPFERRRLRLLSGLFCALQRCGVKVIARGEDPASFEAIVGESSVRLAADRPGIRRPGWRSPEDAAAPASAPMTVEVGLARHGGLAKVWRDRGEDRVEGHAAEIVVAVILYGEMRMRAEAARARRPRLAGGGAG